MAIAFTGKFVYIWFTISSCYSSIPLTLGLIGRNGGLSNLRHNCRFACQQRVLKAFPDPGYHKSSAAAELAASSDRLGSRGSVQVSTITSHHHLPRRTGCS